MKFTNGYWLKRAGWNVQHPREIQTIVPAGAGVKVCAPTKHITFKGAELDSSQLTATVEPIADGIVRVRYEHFQGYLRRGPKVGLLDVPEHDSSVELGSHIGEDLTATVNAGRLRVEISGAQEFELHFFDGDREITSSIIKSQGIAVSPEGEKYIHEQLVIQPGEYIYGLGERFGNTTRNGQVIDLWNEDGGTASEQAYKNVSFYMSNRGYGVFVNHLEKVSYEVASEVNSRVQFSVPGDVLEYYVIAGPEPKDVLNRYTDLTGKPPAVPAWSYGLWLSTSFKTDYSEESVNEVLDEMVRRGIPMSVLHFDCYWMRPSHWCDFTWDPKMFPNPKAMLQRYHDRGIKICVWINPYVGQQADIFAEGVEKGYFVHALDGSVRQWDHWQSGMAWIDFTNPEARAWWKAKLVQLLEDGVDCFKTDFGERIPTDVVWHDGSDPMKMHNYYTYLYNETVFEAIKEVRGEAEAIVFARSAVAGSQVFPVHWGGDSEPTFVSMGETLRGGLSLGLSGYGYWSHDMGGFEGKPDPTVFTRWYPFGMFSSHSRLHGSDSWRTPWIYGEEAVCAARRFTAIKNRLMPYILEQAKDVTAKGVPMLRHMLLENPHDRNCATIDTQYYFGSDLIVAPIFNYEGVAEYYVPSAGWINILDGSRCASSGWQRETHALDSLPVMVKEGTVLPIGARGDVTEYDWSNGVMLYVFGDVSTSRTLTVPGLHGDRTFDIEVNGDEVKISTDTSEPWTVVLVPGEHQVEVHNGTPNGESVAELAQGLCLSPSESLVSFSYCAQ